MEGGPKQFSNPQEEIDFLRRQIAEKEREVLERVPEIDAPERETIAKQELKEYVNFTPKAILEPSYEITEHEVASTAAHVETAHDPVEEFLQLAQEKGIRNALTVLEKTKDAFVIDEVHRRLIEQIHSGVGIADLQEGVMPWHVLHMTLYEVTLPAQLDTDQRAKELQSIVGSMQQLFAGLRTIGSAKHANHFVMEIAVADETDHIAFYVAVPDEFKSLFEKQTHSLYPDAVLTEQVHDYNIYVEKGITLVATVSTAKFYGFPIQPPEAFANDPLNVILNAFSKMKLEGEGAAIQFVVRHPSQKYKKRVEHVTSMVEKGTGVKQAIHESSMTGKITGTISEILSRGGKTESGSSSRRIDHETVDVLRRKTSSEIVEVNIRLVVSSKNRTRAEQMMTELRSTLNQFDHPQGNAFKIHTLGGSAARQVEKAFSFRQFSPNRIMPMSVEELATMIHFPSNGIDSTPQFKQSTANVAPAPTVMPEAGTLLGVNQFRNEDRQIFITEEDRLRHFYIIGQTGTGKSTLMRNMITQDIQRGDGVCMIDPHGADIEDVIASVPPHREKDVIYFDPSRMDHVLGLNMLEYDYSKPEQKTFVVNELFSIFKKLYGSNPESMGPMFEQYFRNATMLVMDDPESGNTLMDISRVMVDPEFRAQKLAKATNPVVVQFWQEIATKAGGEAALQNIVPYIVSKFDVFTTNDYLRPIIGQQHSSFNFRQIMDERKILLVNLSKGRLGDINANLIGMIVVGKILMAALSRADDPTRSYPPFYLHMDEFQNVSTDSISAILSEARKYKLGLTVAHQFIAQLDEGAKDAVFGNVGSLAVFRTGPEDAQFLEQQFAPAFYANDLMQIPNHNAYMRMLANGAPTQPFSMTTHMSQEVDPARAAALIEQSCVQYGRPRVEIEAEIQARYQKPVPGVPPAPVQ